MGRQTLAWSIKGFYRCKKKEQSLLIRGTEEEYADKVTLCWAWDDETTRSYKVTFEIQSKCSVAPKYFIDIENIYLVHPPKYFKNILIHVMKSNKAMKTFSYHLGFLYSSVPLPMGQESCVTVTGHLLLLWDIPVFFLWILSIKQDTFENMTVIHFYFICP